MNIRTFYDYAKKGRGECLLELKENSPDKYKNIVKHIFLNNYAFMESGEYRSFYAYELMHCYNDDIYFFNLLIEKIERIKINNFFNFDYLLNNLFFILKNNSNLDCKIRLTQLLKNKPLKQVVAACFLLFV